MADKIISRPIQGDKDFWRVHTLLVETYSMTPTGFNWDIRRWEGMRFYQPDPTWDSRWEQLIRLWETNDGQLVGAVHPEGRGDAHLELHPTYRHIEEDMIAWAEENLAMASADSRQSQLRIFVYEYDLPRQKLLQKRGYQKLAAGGVIRRLRFNDRPLPQPAVMAKGYTLRTVQPDDQRDCQQIAELLNAAFNRSFHNAEEFHTFATMAPSYCRDLDLIAEAPDGSFAAYVGVPYDEANRRGIFEPVCTHPGHRRKGLAQALMLVGLQRLKALGATNVTVETGDMIPANRLYDSLGFTEVYKGYIWKKIFG